MCSSRKKYFLITITVILLLLTGCSEIKTIPKAEKGVFDLRNWNFIDDGNIKLDGEWNFYWNKLLDFKSLQVNSPDFYARVPEVWNQYIKENNKLPGEGVATYRLRVDTNLPQGTLLGIRLCTISSAYKLFINDRLVMHAGIVGGNAREEKGEYKPQMTVFSIPGKQFDVIIQVSNFHYAKGGLWNSLYLGNENQIQKLNNMIIGKEVFLLGILLIIALFYTAVFLLQRELKYMLYFAILCLFASISIDTSEHFVFINSVFKFETVICIWYSSTTWLVFFLILFMHELFPSRFSGVVSKIYLAISIMFQFVFIFFSSFYYTKFAYLNNMIEVAGVVLTLIIILIGAKKGQKGWVFNVLSIVSLLVCYIHDILYLTNRIQNKYGEIFFVGALLAIFLQMITQAQRIKQYFDNKASAELLFLQAQIKPHFIYNAINTVISVSRYDAEKARTLLVDFSQYLRRSFDFKELNQLVSLKNEIQLAKAYIDIEKARFGNRLEVNFDIQEDLEAKVPILVLQPIIENALIHGVLPKPEGGRIDVTIKREGNLLFFTVRDNGVGINEREIKSITTGERGNIGLANIDSRIRRLYKNGLKIKSEINKGTEVRWITFA